MLPTDARTAYLTDIHTEYCASTKTEKGRILDEARRRTDLHRKVLIRLLSPARVFVPRQRKQRPRVYDGDVTAALVRVWELFDFPCGQRLIPILRRETGRLHQSGFLSCAAGTVRCLQAISSAQADRLLRREKIVRHLSRHRSPPVRPLLHRVIPVKTPGEWNREEPGNLQLDFVSHSGSSTAGDFCSTLSGAEIAFGWWEGVAILGRSQRAADAALQEMRARVPVRLAEVHPDNDTTLLSPLLVRWCEREGVRLSRSRPSVKNDNAWVEQRNFSHVRKVVGYLRYDTEEECRMLNLLYRDLARFRNFFHPTMKLRTKTRVGTKVHRTYDLPRTPVERVLASPLVAADVKRHLQETYARLDPVVLKRRIEAQTNALLRTYEQKLRKPAYSAQPRKKQVPRLVTRFVIQRTRVGLPS